MLCSALFSLGESNPHAGQLCLALLCLLCFLLLRGCQPAGHICQLGLQLLDLCLVSYLVQLQLLLQ
jgi:hypothetical protein